MQTYRLLLLSLTIRPHPPTFVRAVWAIRPWIEVDLLPFHVRAARYAYPASTPLCWLLRKWTTQETPSPPHPSPHSFHPLLTHLKSLSLNNVSDRSGTFQSGRVRSNDDRLSIGCDVASQLALVAFQCLLRQRRILREHARSFNRV